MNANQIINMVVRVVVRKLIRSGISAGMNVVSSRMNRTGAKPGNGHDAARPTDMGNGRD